MAEEIQYPLRINKYLAHKNICSRREADQLIKDGKVFINGAKAELGTQVKKDDDVSVGQGAQNKKVYLAFYKPTGIVTHSPQKDEKSIGDVATFPTKVFPMGRLDKYSEGLIIMTNDGRVTQKLLHPDEKHDKEYVVEVDRKITDDFVKNMRSGVTLDDDYVTRKCIVEQKGAQEFKIILTEGKNRQIRRMCEVFDYKVRSLKRMRIMHIPLAPLSPTQFRILKDEELQKFLTTLGLA